MDNDSFKPSKDLGGANKALAGMDAGSFRTNKDVVQSQRTSEPSAVGNPMRQRANDSMGNRGVNVDMIPPIPPVVIKKQIGPSQIYKFEPTEDEIRSEPLGGGGEIQHPFQITDASENATAKVSVRFGTVNDDIPDNIATAIDLADNTTNYVFIHCAIDVPGDITDTDIEDNTTGLPADDDDSAYILLGTVVTGDGVVTTINQAVTHSLRFAACGRTDDGGDPPAVTDPGSYEFWGV